MFAIHKPVDIYLHRNLKGRAISRNRIYFLRNSKNIKSIIWGNIFFSANTYKVFGSATCWVYQGMRHTQSVVLEIYISTRAPRLNGYTGSWWSQSDGIASVNYNIQTFNTLKQKQGGLIRRYFQVNVFYCCISIQFGPDNSLVYWLMYGLWGLDKLTMDHFKYCTTVYVKQSQLEQ